MTYEVLNGAYHITETIGSGGFGKVKLGYHLSTGDRVAIKIMDKKALRAFMGRIKMEIETMKQLNHQNICKLYQVLETEEHFYLILEHCQGGELFDYIVSKDRLLENDARTCFRQIVAAMAYLHHLGYAHRDLKPENILLDEDQNIKVIDFGLCTMPHGGLSKTFCGSPAYAAPELVARTEYDGLKADMWSLGVLLYTLLCGFLPFSHENTSMLYKKIMIGKYDLPRWLSKESRDLIGLLLHTDPLQRASISGVAMHPWLNKHYLEPVQWRSKFESVRKHLDDECITEMSVHYGVNRQAMRDRVGRWSYDLTSATYLLLCRRKCQGRPVKLISLANVLHSPVPGLDNEFYVEDCGGGDYRVGARVCHNKERSDDDDADGGSSFERDASFFDVVVKDRNGGQCKQFDKIPLVNNINNHDNISVKIDAKESNNTNFKKGEVDWVMGEMANYSSKECDAPKEQENIKPTFAEFLRPQTPKFKRRPITISTTPDQHRCGNAVGTHVHKRTPRPTPTSRRCQHGKALNDATANAMSPSRSYDSQINHISAKKNTPNDHSSRGASKEASGLGGDRTPLRGRVAEVFGSLERGMDRIKDILTPKKKTGVLMPRVAKATNNVSNIRQLVASNYISLVSVLLATMPLTYKTKGFTLKCKSLDNELAFTLEVVRVGGEGLVGLSRKRLKGSSWQYKHICERILSSL